MKKAFKDVVFPVWLPLVEEGILDPLRVADILRRNANRPSDKLMTVEINEALYKFACALSYLGNEMPFGDKSHSPFEKQIAMCLGDLATRAKVNGASAVLLPLCDESPLANYVKKITDLFDLGFDFQFRKKSYDLDLSGCGKIDQSLTRNALHEESGIRGFFDIDQDAKYRWDREAKPARRRLAAVKVQP